MRINTSIRSSFWLTLPMALLAASETPSGVPTIDIQFQAVPSPSPIAVAAPSQAIQFTPSITPGQSLTPTFYQTQEIQFKTSVGAPTAATVVPSQPSFSPSAATHLPSSTTGAPTLAQTQELAIKTGVPSSLAASTRAPSQSPSKRPSSGHASVPTGVPTIEFMFQADSGMPTLASSVFAPSTATSVPSQAKPTVASLVPSQQATAAAGITTASPSQVIDVPTLAPSVTPFSSPAPSLAPSATPFSNPAPSLAPSSIAVSSPAPSSVVDASVPTGVPTQEIRFSGNSTASSTSDAPSVTPSLMLPTTVTRSGTPSAVPSLRTTALGGQSSSDAPSKPPSLSPRATSDQPSLLSIPRSDMPSLVPSTLPSGLRARPTVSLSPVGNPATISGQRSGGSSLSSHAISMALLTASLSIIMNIL